MKTYLLEAVKTNMSLETMVKHLLKQCPRNKEEILDPANQKLKRGRYSGDYMDPSDHLPGEEDL